MLRYLLTFLILVFYQNGLRGEEPKEDLSEIRGFIGPKKVRASELKKVSNSLRHIIALDKGKEKADQSLSHLEEEAWLQLALLYEARQQGIQVSEQEVDEFIHNNRRFQVNQRFDSCRYQTVLSQLEIEPRQFRQTAKDWLLIDKFFDRIRKKVTISEEELRKAFAEAYELRRASYVIFPLREYMNPETIPAPLQGPPMPEFQEEIGQAQQKSLAEAEKYHNLMEKLMKGEELSFQNAARRLGLEVKETGYFSRNVPPAGIRQPDWMWSEAFSISEGELSPVAPIRDGYLFFTITEIFPPTEKQYSRARKNFLLSYRRYKEEERIEEYKKELLTTIKILKPPTPSP
ncbi:MAG: peptidyl-prolyl cis-trans isomerase [Candidatus Aminicenantes bacterium]|nr:MAG: peptidyl-prolyl cis-trans isomerase [Candidatus Aminicenantes bacterium]